MANIGWTQVGKKPSDTTVRAGKTIQILSADRYNFQNLDTGSQFVSLGGHAIVQQERTTFSADSIVLNQKINTLEAIGNVHINDADSIHTYAQYLRYVGKEKKAYLNKQVKLTDGKGILTTEDLVYDVQLKTGTYLFGGKVVNGKTVLTSREGYYYGDTRDVYFKNKVVLTEPDTKIYTDTLLYNLNTGKSTFVSPTKIKNGSRTITTTDGFFDTKTKKGSFNKRTSIDDSTYTFAADKATIDEQTGLSEYMGNATYRSKDSAKGYDLIAGNIKVNKPAGSILATEKPLLLIKQLRDTTFISADTLYTNKLSLLLKTRNIPAIREQLQPLNPPKKTKDSLLSANDSKIGKDSLVLQKLQNDSVKTALSKNKLPNKVAIDTNNDRFFEAYYHVKVFSDSVQAVCDSLFYSLGDSVMRLFYSPVVWNNNNQIKGDTMYMLLENRRPERLLVYENALSIQKLSPNYFNQVKGNSINAFFEKGKMDQIRARGSAEAVYYGVDERNKYVAVNRSTCDVIDVYFEKKKDNNMPQRILLRNNLKGVAYPMGQVNHHELRLRGFEWLEEIRPKSKFDVIKK